MISRTLEFSARQWGVSRSRARALGGFKMVCVCVIGLIAVGSKSIGPADASSLTSRLAHTGKLRLVVPSGWSIRKLGVQCGDWGPGLLLTNLDAESIRRSPASLSARSCSTFWNVARVPKKFVMIDLSRFPVPRPANRRPSKGTKLPISYSSMSKSTKASLETGPGKCTCAERYTYIWVDGVSYSLRAWIGKDASPTARRMLIHAISTIRAST